MKEFKEKRKLFEGKTYSEEEKYSLGNGYWRAFLKRNKHLLVTAYSVRLLYGLYITVLK